MSPSLRASSALRRSTASCMKATRAGGGREGSASSSADAHRQLPTPCVVMSLTRRQAEARRISTREGKMPTEDENCRCSVPSDHMTIGTSLPVSWLSISRSCSIDISSKSPSRLFARLYSARVKSFPRQLPSPKSMNVSNALQSSSPASLCRHHRAITHMSLATCEGKKAPFVARSTASRTKHDTPFMLPSRQAARWRALTSSGVRRGDGPPSCWTIWMISPVV
mmetsp:Transcript_1841/g.5088  ORF Transcript_1841/g.5088 Transcript_1841/m.5088 type:complete len:224 (-) Transcript_1841:395-1066(-)